MDNKATTATIEANATIANDTIVGAVDGVVSEAPLVEDELLVEEISIDGMCGVY